MQELHGAKKISMKTLISSTFVLLFLMTLLASPAFAVNLNGSTGYYGEIASISNGFYGNIGVALPSGTTCNGKPVLILKRDNPAFKEIYATLLAAVTQKRNAHIGPEIGKVIDSNGFCVISEVAIERFPIWSSQ